jgi:hypothetical protein
MILRARMGAAVLLLGLTCAPAAEADTWPTAPACPAGTYTNPDDLTGACLSGTPGNDWVSIAFSPSTGLAGWGTAAAGDQADRVAVAQCVANTNSVCEVIAGIHDGCAAYAVAGDGSTVGGGVCVDSPAASGDALSKLPAGGQVTFVKCSSF